MRVWAFVMHELALILLLAFLLDLLFGDPRYRLHPIRLMGLCIGFFTGILKRAGLGGRWGGIFLVGITECIFVGAFAARSPIISRASTRIWGSLLISTSAIPVLP